MGLTPQDIQAITDAFADAPHKCAFHDTVDGTLKTVSAAQIDLTLAQAVLARDMAAQAEAIKGMTSVTTHAHEELFTRLRQAEEKQAIAETFCKTGGERLKKLEAGQGDCPALKDVKGDLRKVIWSGIIGIGLLIVGLLARAGVRPGP